MDEDTRLRDGPVPREDEGQRPRSGEDQVPRSGLQRPIAAAPAAGTGGYAALDLGTNNCRLLIAWPTGAGLRVVDSFARIIRPGARSSGTSCISSAAVTRTS